MTFLKYSFYILLLLIVALIGLRYSHFLYLGLLDYSSLKKLDHGIYVDSDLAPARSQQLLEFWSNAQYRINHRFGLSASRPILLVTMHQDTANRYGLSGNSGIAFALPWRHYIVVRWHEHLTDILAHELMHAETRELIGYWNYLFNLPTWMDEGIGMQVDDRERYRVDLEDFPESEILRVKGLDQAMQFWTIDPEQDIQNYRAAKAAVAKWLADNPDQSIKDLADSYIQRSD